MLRPNDPRIRANLNRLGETLESASVTTQSYLYSASQRVSPYINPCLAAISTCLEASCQPCFSARDEHFRRRGHLRGNNALGGRARGREGAVGGFDFYDDWERDELTEAEWGEDELDRLLSGGDEGGEQPSGRKKGMSYGSRLGGGGVVGKRKGGGVGGGGDDLNVVPQSSMFGFLESLPWKIGGRGSGRYRPSVADLQEGVGRKGADIEEEGGGAAVALLSGDEEEERRRNGRGRSGTVESRSTTNSLSSRGDLFPSDDEADAVPLDDEFATALERRTTATSDEHGSGKKGGSRPGGSRSSTKTGSSKDTRRTRGKGKRGSSASSGRAEGLKEATEEEVPSMADLKREEERVKREEEALVEERRAAAQRLAHERGLTGAETEADPLSGHQDSKDTDAAKLESLSTEDATRPTNVSEDRAESSALEDSSASKGKPPVGLQ